MAGTEESSTPRFLPGRAILVTRSLPCSPLQLKDVKKHQVGLGTVLEVLLRQCVTMWVCVISSVCPYVTHKYIVKKG